MPEYNFLNLSPSEFEDLTRDLLQKHLQVTFESFTSGRDNGIDLRYSPEEANEIVVQCKRYKDFKSLIANLKKEVSKVRIINPKRYIISTSVGLTPNQKDEILSLFSPFIINTNDILGCNDLNNLLSIYNEIETQHFKLWLSSAKILERILHSKIHNQSNFEEETIKETINLYVDNKSYYKAIDIIKDKRYIIISGIPGIGKTTLARILSYYYLANGFEEFIFLSDSINEAYQSYKEGVKQIFLFDDFLGTNFIENKLLTNEEQRIVKFIERVSKSKDKIIIFTTREYILAQAKQKYDSFNNPSLEVAKCIIDLSEYTKIVKAKILYNHIYFSNLPVEYIENLLSNATYKAIIEHSSFNPRIIQTITKDEIWKNLESSEFSMHFIEFIKNPEGVWKHVYENQISPLSQCILANLLSAGTPISLKVIQSITQNFAKNHFQKYGITYNDIDFKKSISELENTFIRTMRDTDNQILVKYQNPSVQDFLVCYFRDLPGYVSDIISSASYFNQLFKVFSYSKSDYNYRNNKILLDDTQITLVLNKLNNEFDDLNSTTSSRYSETHFSDYTKLSEIIKHFNIENFSHLKKLVISKFKELLKPKVFELDSYDIKAFIDLIEELQYEIEFDVTSILYHISESILDINDFEEFERLEMTFGDKYLDIVSNDERHRQRINTLLEIEVDHVEDDYLEDKLYEIVKIAEKYNIPYLNHKQRIEAKIESKKESEGEYDWNLENSFIERSESEIENKAIKNIFDSLKSQE
ncbi:nSTAND3 domain-containing NTPase [Chryseobacterium culicis]|uniref:Restriction endonuclease n=1 Tax=Chryseobacterium culicis TaxID=680127 RepID=A0A1H6H712_CHRCI|nr:restriction endonuclease [Chryseobacterium culicis]SEH31581.1 Restriction endonuclease [Chryseobacterium culicis]